MKYYLATTAISKIWDKEKDLLLLGPWCLLNNENSHIKSDFLLIPSPWKPAAKLKEAADFCYQTYRDLLPNVSEELNRLHNLSYPVRSWQISVGPWLLQFIKIFYDRYKRIENAISLFPDLYTHVLPCQSLQLSSLDTCDFFGKVNLDIYNLQLFSFINYELIPQNILETKVSWEYKDFTIKYHFSWKARIFNFLFSRFFADGKILLSDMYHLKNIDKLRLKLKTGKGCVGFIDFFENSTMFKKMPQFDSALRSQFKLTEAKDKFQSLLFKVIPLAMPLCYMEGFKDFNNYAINLKVCRNVKAVGSLIGWLVNEQFKFFAANSVLNNSKLIEFQHGSGYETYLSMLSEALAIEKDHFYIWGIGNEKNGKIKYLPSPHLSRLKDTYKKENENLLFAGMSLPKYHYRFTTFLQPEDMLKYFEEKKLFLQNLKEDLKGKLLYRPYPYHPSEYQDYEREELGIIKQMCPHAKFLIKGKLVEWLKKVKLVVIDHPHTALIEALTINVPSIFYWDHNVYLMREEAEYYFELLRRAGIVYKDPVSAAKKINEIFNEPWEWWSSFEVQNAKEKFCKRYAHTNKDWLDLWVKELVKWSS